MHYNRFNCNVNVVSHSYYINTNITRSSVRVGIKYVLLIFIRLIYLLPNF